MKKIEILIPRAIKAIEVILEKNHIVPKEYDGYAASLGASIFNSGLLPALSFYTDLHRYKLNKPDEVLRLKLLQAIYYVLESNSTAEDIGRTALLDKVLADRGALKKWKRDILDATIALKLALRTFKHSDQ